MYSTHEEWGKRHLIATDFVEFFSPEIAQIDGYTRMSREGVPSLLSHEDKRLNSSGVFHVDANFFEFFSFELLNSNTAEAFSQDGQAIITASLSEKLFGEKDPIGQEIVVNKGQSFIVAAMATDPPKNSTIQFELLLYKQGYFKNKFETMHGVRNVLTYISTIEGHDQKAIISGINAARDKPNYRTFMDSFTYELLPLTDQRLSAPYEFDLFAKNDRRYVMLFSGIGLVILLLAMINYVNLVTAQSVRRKKEIGLRKIIGARKQQLIYYQLIESIVLTLISFSFAFAIAERLMPIFNRLLDKNIQLQYFGLDFFAWVLLIGISLGVLSGVYPALYIARIKPLALLGNNITAGKGLLRKGLVLIQFIASAILITTLVIMTNQMNFLKVKELGYNAEFLVTVPLDHDSTHLFQKVKTEVETISGVKSVSVIGFRVGGSMVTSVMNAPNKQGEGASGDALNTVFADADFLSTMEVEMYWASEVFDKKEFKDNQMLINYSLAEELGWLEEPDDRRLYGWNDQVGKEVVGIIADFHFKSLKDEIEPLVIRPLQSYGNKNILVRLEGGKGAQVLGEIGNVYETLFDRPFDYYFIDDQMTSFYQKEQGQFKLFQLFSSLAVFISMLGLVALTIYMVEQRRKEVSIRKVLGASLKGLLLMLNREYTLLVIIAFLVASPIAYHFMQGWLEEFQYRVNVNPLLFVSAFLTFLILSWLVTLFQSLRVSRENPADVLREE